ncbi:MAG: hypothetical protein E7441_04790 [Ruminococcaceae bacterium]|nr:hypothetical protein [Oscillospiraceae bacterium]
MERDIILNGVHVGEHSFVPDKILDELRERVVEPGFNFVSIRPRRGGEIPQEFYIEWAKYLAENKIYFAFLYMVQFAPKGRESLFDAETVDKIKKIAGEYFLGEQLGETGSNCACKLPGYYMSGDTTKLHMVTSPIKAGCADMEEAHREYINIVSGFIAIDKKQKMPNILSVEATALSKYNAEAGVTIPLIEMPCGNPDIIISSLRGTARAYGSKMWGTYTAHEWYGGVHHTDVLKRKRLELEYKYAYLAGSNILLAESGDECIASYGIKLPKESEISADYRRVMQNMNEYIKKDFRPKGGPKVKVAFVSGLHDAWGGWGGGSVWGQFFREEWGHNEAEHSWRLLDEIGVRRTWADVSNYGDYDLSALPAYGMYDIIPIEADVDALCKYDYLIFLGWNTMTDENMDKLTEYVSRGGHLLMTCAHLNTQTARKGEFKFIAADKIEKLFGCRFIGEIRKTNYGHKFRKGNANENVIYPATESLACDPLYSAGYVEYARFGICGGCEIAYAGDSFPNRISDLPTVIENRIGEGTATLVTSINYPGHPALFPLYRSIAREFVTASARTCDIKVVGSERVRWSVYEGNKIYLLNTDYDMPVTVKVISGEKEQLITLESLELKALEV